MAARVLMGIGGLGGQITKKKNQRISPLPRSPGIEATIDEDR